MNARELVLLPDVQSSIDPRNIAINRVGVKALRHPVTVAGRDGPVATVATFDMFVALPGERKGTHMSRFLEVLQNHREPMSMASLRALLQEMLRHLEADMGWIEIRFPYFVDKAAPVSGVRSLMDYDVTLTASMEGGVPHVRQKVCVPVTSLCPCSKRISDYGAHNQRSHIIIDVETVEPMAIEEQIRVAEEAASCELWGVLKRPDEKYVTERAYDNPKFVEDTVRDVALALRQDPRVVAFRVESENFESIHNHSAYALIEQSRATGPRK